MPTPTYTPLANITLSANATSVTFSSIPATYRDLILVIYGSTNTGSGEGQIIFNGVTSSGNYDQIITGAGFFDSGGITELGSSSDKLQITSSGYNFNTENSYVILNVMDYSTIDKHKSCLWRVSPGSFTQMGAGRFAQTSAITSISGSVAGTSSAIGSTFSLYGIAA